MKIDAAIIKFPNKDIARYEIYIEAYHYTDSMRFPIKNQSFIEKEFNSAIELCNAENEKDILKRVYLKELYAEKYINGSLMKYTNIKIRKDAYLYVL